MKMLTELVQILGLTKRQKKKWIVILLVAWISSTAKIYYYLSIVSGHATNQEASYKGWYVNVGDTATYNILVNSNDIVVTIVDKIAAEYNFSEVSGHKGVSDALETTIKATKLSYNNI